MAAGDTAVDFRRTDLRTNVLENPYWITSATIDGAVTSGLKDKGCVVFSFPTAGLCTVIYEVFLEVLYAFTATTVIDVGIGTIPLEASGTGATISSYDLDEFIAQADITATLAGVYASTTANGSDWLVASAAKTWASPCAIVGAASTVPVVAINPQTATIIAGKCRLHMLITNVPVKA